MEVVDAAIAIGKKYFNWTVDDIKKNLDNIDIDFTGKMQRSLLDEMTDYSDKYSVEELSLIFKGAAIGEVYLRDGHYWAYGSVSTTTRVFDKLIKIDYIEAQKIKKWADHFGLAPGLLN